MRAATWSAGWMPSPSCRQSRRIVLHPGESVSDVGADQKARASAVLPTTGRRSRTTSGSASMLTYAFAE
jgi:hypothetical protein